MRKQYVKISLMAFMLILLSPFALSVIFYFNQLLELIEFHAPDNSIYHDLSGIDFLNFYRISFLCLVIFISSIGIATLILRFFIKETLLVSLLTIMFKVSMLGSLLTPMIFTLSKEQFNVVTAVISFIALFSFVFPQNVFNYLKKSNMGDNDTKKPD